MPLLLNQLAEEIQKFTDMKSPSFVGFPATDGDAAAAWSNAVDVYVGGGLSIIPPSSTGAAAKAALEVALVGMAAPGAAVALFDVAFAAWATAIVVGMAPASIGTPPPAPLSLTPPTIVAVFAAGLAGADGATQALAMATLIDAWVRTGTSTPSGGGPVSPWA